MDHYDVPMYIVRPEAAGSEARSFGIEKPTFSNLARKGPEKGTAYIYSHEDRKYTLSLFAVVSHWIFSCQALLGT